MAIFNSYVKLPEGNHSSLQVKVAYIIWGSQFHCEAEIPLSWVFSRIHPTSLAFWAFMGAPRHMKSTLFSLATDLWVRLAARLVAPATRGIRAKYGAAGGLLQVDWAWKLMSKSIWVNFIGACHSSTNYISSPNPVPWKKTKPRKFGMKSSHGCIMPFPFG